MQDWNSVSTITCTHLQMWGRMGTVTKGPPTVFRTATTRASNFSLVDVLKVLGDQLGYFSPPSLAQAAPCVAAAELGYFQPMAKIPQVPSANRH